MTDEIPNRWQFSLRTLMMMMGLAAVVLTAGSAPGVYGGLGTFVIALVVPGLLMTAAFSGGGHTKAFCLPALVPLAFGLYGLAWAFGWTVYGASSPSQLIQWFDDRSSVIKAVALASWACGGVAGLSGLGFRWVMHR